MANIVRISGKYEDKLSQPNQKWVLAAGEENLFEVPEWIPKTADSPKAITWKIKDNAEKITFETISGTTIQKIKFGISKKYSGSYGYYVEATLNGTSEIAGAYILGYSPPKVTVAKIMATNPYQLTYDAPIPIHIETEGLNGNQLQIEVYAKKNDQLVGTYLQECFNGEIDLTITNAMVWKGLTANQSTSASATAPQREDFFIKVIDKATASYIMDGKGNENFASFAILDSPLSPSVQVPDNLTPAKIGKPDTSPVVTGMIDLEKVLLNNKFDVCNDGINGTGDYENVWILKAKDNGLQYHWLKKSLMEDIDKAKKPLPLPITFASTEKFIFTATFKTISPVDGLIIRVRDKDGNYLFANTSCPKKNKGEEFEITFSSDNIPFTGTIQYLPNFELIFDYSFDQKSWTPLGTVKFCLYVTLKESLFTKFNISGSDSMQIVYSGRKYICETLLWLGCKQASIIKTAITDEEKILDEIFKAFAAPNLKVTRAREGKKRPDGATSYLLDDFTANGMGYWRGKSTLSNGATFAPVRCLRFLLQKGEARCGEWTLFFQHVILTQGIDVNYDTIGICTDLAHFNYAPNFNVYTFTSSSYNSNLASLKFAVKNAVQTNITNPDIISGNSPGQGFPATQPTFIDHFWFYYSKSSRFFDASYGKTFTSTDSNLTKYCQENLGSIFILNQTTGVAKIETTGIHNFIRSTKDVF